VPDEAEAGMFWPGPGRWFLWVIGCTICGCIYNSGFGIKVEYKISQKRENWQSKGERMFKLRSFMAFFAALAILSIVGIMGCSQVPTANIEAEDSDNQVLLSRSPSVAKILGDSASFETIVSAKEGGVVRLLDVELTFPAFALSSDTLISIDIPDLSVFANDFGTDGLVFNVPVKVVMSYRDADLSGVLESSIKMVWYNNSTDCWEIIDCQLDSSAKTVTAFVYHFSAYGLISD